MRAELGAARASAHEEQKALSHWSAALLLQSSLQAACLAAAAHVFGRWRRVADILERGGTLTKPREGTLTWAWRRMSSPLSSPARSDAGSRSEAGYVPAAASPRLPSTPGSEVTSPPVIIEEE